MGVYSMCAVRCGAFKFLHPIVSTVWVVRFVGGLLGDIY